MEEVGWSLNEYQAVCGATETRVDHPILTVYTAMAILDYIKFVCSLTFCILWKKYYFWPHSDKTFLKTYTAKCNAFTVTFVIFYYRELKHKIKLPNVHVRIAVHTGDIVTAVLGARHWKYDLLGEDVIRAKHLLGRAHNG